MPDQEKDNLRTIISSYENMINRNAEKTERIAVHLHEIAIQIKDLADHQKGCDDRIKNIARELVTPAINTLSVCSKDHGILLNGLDKKFDNLKLYIGVIFTAIGLVVTIAQVIIKLSN